MIKPTENKRRQRIEMIDIAILGFGVVGGGCADLLSENRKKIATIIGDEVNIKYILDRRKFENSPYKDKIVNDFDIILRDKSVKAIIETMGGARPAYDFTLSALEAKKSVITSNKEVVSKFGDILLETARKNKVNYLFEASVGGGIPLIRTILHGISPSNEIDEIYGILNGTTNYILTKMFKSGISFETALTEAKEKGYAEADPTADIEGIDAARKTNILAAIMTGKLAGEELIKTEGITRITRTDVENAKKYKSEIKLLGRVVRRGDKVYAYVSPHFVPNENPISQVSLVYNAVSVRGNYIGDTMLYGQGAGAKATASAVISDLVNVLSGREATADIEFRRENDFPSDFSDFVCGRYVRFAECNIEKVMAVFDGAKILSADAIVTKPMSEEAFGKAIASFNAANVIPVLSE